jgi:hypothetical protein
MVIALIAGTLSHYVLDSIPHSDAIYYTRIGILPGSEFLSWLCPLRLKPHLKNLLPGWPVLAVELFIITIAIFSLSFLRGLPFLVILSGFIGGAWPDFISMPVYFLGENKIIIALNSFHDLWHSSYLPAPIPSVMFQLLLAVISLLLLI